MKVSKKYKRMADMYRYFSRDFQNLDYSAEALEEMYHYESMGGPSPDDRNGYLIGKRYMDVNIAMWKEDIEKGLLFKSELYADPAYPEWFLDKIL